MGVQPPNFPGAPLNPFYLQQVAAASFQQQPQYWQQPQVPQPQVCFLLIKKIFFLARIYRYYLLSC